MGRGRQGRGWEMGKYGESILDEILKQLQHLKIISLL